MIDDHNFVMNILKYTHIKTIVRWLLIYKLELSFAFIFTIIFVLGHLLSTYASIDITIGGRITLISFCAGVIIWILIFLILIAIKQQLLQKHTSRESNLLRSFSDKKLWFVTSAVIFLCYLPIILTCFSVLSPDSWSSVKQATGELPLTNAHPIIFTAFVSVFIHVGLLFGSLEFGLLLFSLAQSAILALIFAKIIVWMRREKINKSFIMLTFLFYAVLPINAIAGIIMWKDILFAGFGLLFLLLLRKLYLEKDKFFIKKNLFYFIFIAFLFCTWRNNGIYAYIIFLALALIINHKLFLSKKYLSLLFAPIVLFVIYSTFSSLISTPTSLGESMSLPLQQIARTVKYHSNSITSEDKATINEILPYHQLDEIYNPGLSDPVKSSFNVTVFKENKSKYLKLWAKLFIEHKKTYLAATLYNTYGYVYPYYSSSTTTDIVPDNASHFNALQDYTDSGYSSGAKPAVEKYQAILTSVLPVLRNIGLYTCIILLGLYAAIIKKKWELTGIFIILSCLFLTTILGPVNGEFRYLYLFVVAAPFIIGSIFSAKKPERTKNKYV